MNHLELLEIVGIHSFHEDKYFDLNLCQNCKCRQCLAVDFYHCMGKHFDILWICPFTPGI